MYNDKEFMALSDNMGDKSDEDPYEQYVHSTVPISQGDNSYNRNVDTDRNDKDNRNVEANRNDKDNRNVETNRNDENSDQLEWMETIFRLQIQCTYNM